MQRQAFSRATARELVQHLPSRSAPVGTGGIYLTTVVDVTLPEDLDAEVLAEGAARQALATSNAKLNVITGNSLFM
jgi:hypothetical protein